MGGYSVKSEKGQLPERAEFLAEAGKIAAKFSWPTKPFDHGTEIALVAEMVSDADFERFIWSYDTRRRILRCLAVSRLAIPPKRRAACLELCARINENLPFGCAEYSFADQVIVFRDSADVEWGPFKDVLIGTTQRALNLASDYAPAIHDTLEGEKPEDAVAKVAAETSDAPAE
jgi:hypothetical protein